eukprot:scaffold181172_cov24-Tisochrysis_lutea.AAC.1
MKGGLSAYGSAHSVDPVGSRVPWDMRVGRALRRRATPVLPSDVLGIGLDRGVLGSGRGDRPGGGVLG